MQWLRFGQHFYSCELAIIYLVKMLFRFSVSNAILSPRYYIFLTVLWSSQRLMLLCSYGIFLICSYIMWTKIVVLSKHRINFSTWSTILSNWPAMLSKYWVNLSYDVLSCLTNVMSCLNTMLTSQYDAILSTQYVILSNERVIMCNTYTILSTKYVILSKQNYYYVQLSS